MDKLCECGCGEKVKNRFLSGHNARLNPPMNNKEIAFIIELIGR